jgi:hypothetical protein
VIEDTLDPPCHKLMRPVPSCGNGWKRCFFAGYYGRAFGHPTINLGGRYRTTNRPTRHRTPAAMNQLTQFLHESSSQAVFE